MEVQSDYLERNVTLDIYLPPQFDSNTKYSLLLVNDGQDLITMQFEQILNELYQKQQIQPIIIVGIHCGVERKLEYGTAYAQDYMQRGSKAGLYTKFIFDECLPWVRKKLNTPVFVDKSMAGFSLGALSALDIVWNYASEFKRVGVFSGSLWWRRKAYDDGYDDEMDRLMHLQVRKGVMHPWLQFYFQCGLLDETADRNENGIIDSIDDTLDIIFELKYKGYSDEHIRYVLIEDGKHDVATWAIAFPDFLKWGWGK